MWNNLSWRTHRLSFVKKGLKHLEKDRNVLYVSGPGNEKPKYPDRPNVDWLLTFNPPPGEV